MYYVGNFLKEIGRETEKTRVVFGVEDTISTENNAHILDRAQSKAVQVYYGVATPTRAGFDIYREIRWLGKDRICEFHLKDNPHYLGKGSVDFAKLLEPSWISASTAGHI